MISNSIYKAWGIIKMLLGFVARTIVGQWILLFELWSTRGNLNMVGWVVASTDSITVHVFMRLLLLIVLGLTADDTFCSDGQDIGNGGSTPRLPRYEDPVCRTPQPPRGTPSTDEMFAWYCRSFEDLESQSKAYERQIMQDDLRARRRYQSWFCQRIVWSEAQVDAEFHVAETETKLRRLLHSQTLETAVRNEMSFEVMSEANCTVLGKATDSFGVQDRLPLMTRIGGWLRGRVAGHRR